MAVAAVASPPSALRSSNDPVTTMEFGQYTKHDQVDVENSLPDILLVKMMVGVLKDKGYGEDEQRKVASLAMANMVDASYTLESATDVDSHQISTVLAESLLDEKTLRQKGVYLNSNEPVLLVEASEKLAIDGLLAEIRLKSLDVLRTRGIKPVRVYTRVAEKEDESKASAMLLNVVNTDIGGPSMVQLLDAAFHGAKWEEDLVSKEAWNGYDLLWRDEIQLAQQKSQHQDAEGETNISQAEPEPAPQSEIELKSESVPEIEEERQQTTKLMKK